MGQDSHLHPFRGTGNKRGGHDPRRKRLGYQKNIVNSDTKYMLRALELARRGRGLVEPNPLVGCVIVGKGRIVGEGFHRRFGGPHAEVIALRRAGRAARSATCYVTLEPCCHVGKTGPCTTALVEAGVKRVVVACRDPFHKVAGKGIAALRRAGIKVDVGLCRAEAESLNAPFIKVQNSGLPWVIAKWAMTLDGAISTGKKGRGRWISGPQSRMLVHELRARVDAVIVGIGTVLADDPRLTARGVRVKRVARRVVIDPSLRIPTGSQLVRSAGRTPLTVVTRSLDRVGRGLRKPGVELVAMPNGRGGRIDPERILRWLAREHGATNVLVEGGAKTLKRFFDAGMVDEAWVFVAPRVVTDRAAVRLDLGAETRKPTRPGGPVPLRLVESLRVGRDIRLRFLRPLKS